MVVALITTTNSSPQLNYRINIVLKHQATGCLVIPSGIFISIFVLED